MVRRPLRQGGDRVRTIAPRKPVAVPEDDYTSWTELTVKLTRVPWQAGTLDIYNLLSPRGYIATISLEENSEGNRNGEAFVTFLPPPAEPFWEWWVPEAEDKRWTGMKIKKQNRKRTFLHRSPVHRSKIYPEHTVSA